MRPLALVRLLCAIGATLWLVGCGADPTPNVLVVTFDTTRFDRLGANGDPEAHTPVVDALAKRGVLFERAYASVPITLPSHTTIFSGLAPVEHGVHNNGRFRVPDEIDTLAEMFQRTGYDTAAFVSAFVLAERYNLGQGFDVYSDEVDAEDNPFSSMVAERDGRVVTDEALSWLGERSPDTPFLLWTHYYGPHHPRTVELPYQELSDGYRAEIAYTDAQLGRLLDGVAAADSGAGTLIVFTADHGESLGEHGEDTHAIVAYDSTLHVPLMIAGPGIPAGVRTRTLARHIDLVPTILQALGRDVPPALRGRDLLAALGDAGEPALEPVGWFESLLPEIDMGWHAISGVRTPRWKYTAEPQPVELYDVTADPRETRNLAAEQPEVLEQMATAYAALAALRPAETEATTLRDIDPDEAAQLAALGYVESAAEFDEDDRPDPRKFVAAQRWINAARSFASEGRHGEAIRALETLVESRSMRPLALVTLAPIYERAGRTEEALATYRRYAKLAGSDEARFRLAKALAEAGRAEDALLEIEGLSGGGAPEARLRASALAILGRHAEARAVLDAGFANSDRDRLRERARLVLMADAVPDAERELRELHGRASDDLLLRSALGFHLAVYGAPEQREEALVLLLALQAEQPESAEVLANLGWGLYRAERPLDAKRALEAALKATPERLLDRVRLAFVLADLGETQRAIDELNTSLAYHPGASWADDARARRAELHARLAQVQAAEGSP